jgi:antitoxin CptB
MHHNAADPDRLKKLKFRAWRRGFREADLILGPYADENLASLTEEELDLFEALISEPDQDLYAWIVDLQPTPARFDHAVMNQIKAFRFRARAARADDVGG